MGKRIKLSESELNKIVRRVIEESPLTLLGDDGDMPKSPNRKERQMVKAFKSAILSKLSSGGSDWAVNNPNPSLQSLIDGIRKVCDDFESFS